MGNFYSTLHFQTSVCPSCALYLELRHEQDERSIVMEEIQRELLRLKEQAAIYRRTPQGVYEVTLDKCNHIRAPCSKSSYDQPWMFEGMTNNVKPMWAVVVGGGYTRHTFGFVWDTTVSPNDITVQEITSVKCEHWQIWGTLDHLRAQREHGSLEGLRLLGTTTLWENEIEKAGFHFSFLQANHQPTSFSRGLGAITWFPSIFITFGDCGCLSSWITNLNSDIRYSHLLA